MLVTYRDFTGFWQEKLTAQDWRAVVLVESEDAFSGIEANFPGSPNRTQSLWLEKLPGLTVVSAILRGPATELYGV